MARSLSGFAIVGIGCRFPGHANSPQKFWENLVAGIDAIGPLPADRFDVQQFFDPDPARPGRVYVTQAGMADHAGGFDASFFGISRREAAHMDPQQRMLLEVAWEALEDGGITLERVAGSRTGVYIGISGHDFATMLTSRANRERIGPHSLTGIATSIAANRLSYQFDLHGPSLAVDTACSSSLTAVHLAIRGLLEGECDLALAGGVNLYLAPESAIAMAKASMLAPDGRCKAFDARANGFVRGEGAGIIVLKPLSMALQDRDRIYAIVRGTAINQDGRTVGMTVPSAAAQAAMIRQALNEAGVSPGEVQYVEAHGTGTPTGDPLEAAAIGEVFGGRNEGVACVIGSVKTNIGHLEAASGIAGLIKAALSIKNRAIPASLHFGTPNPAIPFERLGLRVAAALEPWPTTSGQPMAGVNSFGIGGSNAHALLEAAPEADMADEAPAGSEAPHVLLLSAKTSEALLETARRHADFLHRAETAVHDICFTAAVRRTHHWHRMAIIANTRAELAARLESGGAGALSGIAPHDRVPKLAFVYSGMGLQNAGMGKELLHREPAFRQVVEECDSMLAQWAEWPLLKTFENGDEARATEPAVAQVTNFVLQAALTDLWRSWGVVPDAVAGHSVGEVAAAYAAGALSLEDGLRLAYHRGRLAQRASGQGGMLVASLSTAEAESLVSRYGSKVVLAAVNSPVSITLSGDRGILASIAAELEAAQHFARFVPVSVPYHGPALDQFREELLDSLQALSPRRPSIPMVSTAYGTWVNGALLGADHWWNEFRNPVQFARSTALLIEDGVEMFLEVGPHSSLKAPISESLTHAGARGTTLFSLRRGENDRETMLRAAATLHVHGRQVKWERVFQGGGRFVSLPSYPWQREEFGTAMSTDNSGASQPAGADSGHPLLGVRIHSARPCWQANLADHRLSYLDGHVVQGAVLYPAAAYIETSLAAGEALWPDAGATIEELEFRKMLVLPEGRASFTQWTCDALGTFEFFSTPWGGVSASSASWTLHATGRLRKRAPSPEPDPGVVDLTAIRMRCAEEIARRDWYESYRKQGLQYEGAFQGVEAAWRGNGEALGQIRLASDPGNYRIHPALLDSAFQVFGAAIHTRSAPRTEKRTLLPVSVSAVRWYGPAGDHFWVYAKLRQSKLDAFEGDVQLLNADGRVVAAIDRLRCRLVGAEETAPDGNMLYRATWHEHSVERRPMMEPPAKALIPAIESTARRAASSQMSVCDLKFEASLNALAAAFIRAACGRLSEAAGQPADSDSPPECLGVAAHHRAVFRRLKEITREFPAGPMDAAGCRKFAADLRAAYPVASGMVDLVSHCGEALDRLLTDKIEAQELLFGPAAGEILSEFYTNSPVSCYYNQAAADIAGEIAKRRSGSGKLRILEVGAGTGGTTAFVLPKLPEGSADYVFTDVSPVFLSRAQERFAGHPELNFALLDIETGRSEGVFPHAEFDIVIASNALHTAADVRNAIRNVRQRLAPGGLLILIEITRPPVWTDIVFGFFPPWWRLGEDGRLVHSWISKEDWLHVLHSEGMAEAVILPETDDECQIVSLFVARAPLQAKEWLIVPDSRGVAEQIAQALGRRGERARMIGVPPEVGAWAGVVHLASLDQRPAEGLAESALTEMQTATYDGIVKLLRDLTSGAYDPPSIWLLTAGAQAVSAQDAVPNVSQSGLWGLGRVLGMEFPAVDCHLADFSPACEDWEIELLVDCLVHGDREDELAFRDGKCFKGRVEPAAPGDFSSEPLTAGQSAVDSGRNSGGSARGLGAQVSGEAERVVSVSSAQVRLEVGELGSLDSISLHEIRRMRPGPEELLIRVRAAGLNFRDVMMALGMLPAPESTIDCKLPLGLECAGVVEEVGEGVKNFAPGDEVIAIAGGTFASHAIARAPATVRKPAWLSFEEAATILVAFTTVQNGLHHLARISAGERVLIHSATGGVGMAGIQLCRAAGAEIFATAGSHEKREMLRAMGIAHVMDSRSLAFADEIMSITSGEGVDVILNSLSGEAIPKGLSILRAGGRFVELGKRDLLDDAKIGLLPFAKTLSFFAMNVDQIFSERTSKVGDLAAEVLEGFADGRYTPLPRTEFPLTEAPAAFRRMSQAKHIGKIILTAHESEYRVKATRDQYLFRKDGSYLITGGLGGFGLAVAKWMVSQGARNIALMGRSATPIPENQAAFDELTRARATVRVLAGDVSVEADVARVLSTMRSEMAPLAGVIHGAMTLRDRPLIDLTPEDWNCALAPKVRGALLLDRLTRSDHLDCFVLFSSAASIFGNPMQGNYASANAFLDALAHNRRARGLPGLAVCWGVLSGAGYVARQPEIQRHLERTGFRGITLQEAFDALEFLLRGGQAHAIVARIDWGQLWRTFPHTSRRRLSAMSSFENGHAERPIGESCPVLAELKRADQPSRRFEIASAYIVRQVAKVLSEPESKIDPAAALTNLGLDSLMAVELQTLFQADLGVRVPATRLLQGFTARGLADLILDRLADPELHELASEAENTGTAPRDLPLAFEQLRLWFLQQLHPESPVYNVAVAVRFSGELDRLLLHRALREVAQRHEALRATVVQEAGEPRQRIAAELDLQMPEIDLSPLDAERCDAETARLKREEAEQPFAFDGGPLMRAKLLRQSGREHVLMVTIHHLIVDAWSMPIIARDMAHIYQRLIHGQSPSLPSPAPGYADFIARQRAAHNAPDQLAYWKKQLAGVPRLQLPTDRPHPPVRTFAGARLEFLLPRSLFERLAPCGRSENATLFMTLLAAFEVFLHRYSGQDDLCVGVPVATRAREGAMDRVGCLVNTLAMRARITGDQTFRTVLRNVRQIVLEAYDHQDVTWERVVESANPGRDPSIPPIFQVLLVVHRISWEGVEFPGLVMYPEYTSNRSTTFDLVLLIDTARCEAAIEYNTDIFDASTIERLREYLQRLLEAVPNQLDMPVRELPIFGDDVAVVMPIPTPSGMDVCLHRLFEEQVRRTPDATAVFGASLSLTYAQLDHAANRLALRLQACGVGPESRVAICVRRSPLAVAGILAILKAGGAFVPLDPAYPCERLAFMLRDSAPELLLAEPQAAEGLYAGSDVPVMAIGVEDLLQAEPHNAPTSAVRGANLAYVMYTSGSTGQPKGVMVEHGMISNQVLWRQSAFPLDSSDAVLHITSLSFDPSIWEIFGPLAAGAAVVIPEGTGADGEAVRSVICRHGLTVLHGVPSVLRSLLDQSALAGCDTLRHVFCGGEPLSKRLADDIRVATRAAVHQLYGCTETSIDATCLSNVAAGSYASPPVGRPISNANVYILDDRLQPVPQGVRGEVYIGGAGVARGYWNQPELTASRFLSDPFHSKKGARMYRTGDLGRLRNDGNIELLGRMDRQIKLRGLRIEPAEIEGAVCQHPFVRASVVDLRDVAGEPALVAWCVLDPGRAITTRDAIDYIAQRLPRSLVPRHWVFLEKPLPVTPAGKIDLAKLPDPEPESRNGSAPSAPPGTIERRVAAVWEELLSVTPIQTHENFFDLGGHSLLAVRLAARLSTELGVYVPVSAIMSKPTIAELAQTIMLQRVE